MTKQARPAPEFSGFVMARGRERSPYTQDF
jgi:hypothetical protein